MKTVLGIESSCDETAASVVRRHADGSGEILSNVILSQIEDHAQFGGVVPEIAARAHLDGLDGAIAASLKEAGVTFEDLDSVAVTAGPGLSGGLIVGTMTARAIAAVHNLPLMTINHLEGHALTARLTDGVAFPYLLLLVSGGHTQILLVRGLGDYRRWATTIDDALGEAFDKTGKLLGLAYPGGPNVERMALNGDPKEYAFPRPLSGRDTLNMSFSGLKTAVRHAIETADVTEQIKADICASFQAAVADILADRVQRSFNRFERELGGTATLVVAGGVAANTLLRNRLQTVCDEHSWALSAPPLALCTDNAAMIAWVALEHLAAGTMPPPQAGIRPRWPLDAESARASAYGSGRKGAKA
ncbi:MAG: tRNA (adenosine(37)-N6)-threonylcarbamoyltransferase complex transferase subunit TsaD [Pseudomonadota bacterium]